jgi:anaerobic selenocysteine-containing dehydrogenase
MRDKFQLKSVPFNKRLIMKRRDFLKSSMLMAAVSTVIGKATGLLGNVAQAATVWVTAGKLGYKEVSPQAANKKLCSTCKHYQADAATAGGGKCVLPAMKTAMKAAEVPYVKEGAYCNMWAKKA